MLTDGFITDLHRFDQTLTLEMNSWSGEATDVVFQTFSMKLIWIPLYLLILFLLWRRLGWKKLLVAVVCLALTFTVCDQLANFIKDIVARPRPCHDNWMVSHGLDILENKGGRYGFYSAHAANALGFAICASHCFRDGQPRKGRLLTHLLIIWAILVGLSRIFVGKHYLGDVLAGYIVGIFFGLFFSSVARLVIMRYLTPHKAA